MGYAWRCRTAGRLALAARLYALLLELQLRSRFADPPFGDSRNRYLLTFPVQLLSPRLHDRLVQLAGRRPRQKQVLPARGDQPVREGLRLPPDA